jgi:hypothetical protein
VYPEPEPVAERLATSHRLPGAGTAAGRQQAPVTLEWDVEAAFEAEETQHLADAGDLILGRYRIERRLGSGGFGTVYAARDERLHREVAVKVIPRAATGDQHADREARVAARLNHPSVVALFELAGDPDNVYLVSELVDGRTLAELIAEDALSDRDIARIGATLCDGLVHAHQRGVIHRDVKPQNVMVVAEPAVGAGFAKLTDFGVAHLAGDEPLTRTGDVVGTLAYMAPEQAEGRRVTWEADVYSLALTLFEAWTGFNPVRRRGPAATARQLGKRLPSLGKERRDLPIELCATIDAALDARPERRPQPEQLAAVLREWTPQLSDEGALDADELREGARGRLRVGASGRLLAAGGAAALTFGVLEVLAAEGALVEPEQAALLAGLLTGLLPRLGWLATAITLCAWLAFPTSAREGMAVVLLIACVPVPLLLARAPSAWSLPALAPLLGAAGAGPAFAAAAGQATTWARRAALGAIGFLWLGLAEAAVEHPMMFGLAGDQRARDYWVHDGWRALAHGVLPLLGSPVMLCALAWGAFAAVLPALVRSRRLAPDVLGASIWAAGLYAAVLAVGRIADPGSRPRGALVGSAAAAAIAVACAAARRRRSERAVAPEPVP